MSKRTSQSIRCPSDKVQDAAYKIAQREVGKGENKINYRNIKEEVFASEVATLEKSSLGRAESFAKRMGFAAKL